MQSIEMTGEKFNLEVYLAAQEICRRTCHKIASQVQTGFSEKDGQMLILEEFKKVGVKKFWHPSKFRIGPDTIKSFREFPDESIRMQSEDIFFLDVGPIIEDHEADYGKTFVFPRKGEVDKNLNSLADASFQVWQETAKQWQQVGLTGTSLFEFADKAAQSRGFQLNPLMAGHRLGDFPHALFSKDKLFSTDIVPQKNLWVLEIHIIDPDSRRGSFFEDILS